LHLSFPIVQKFKEAHQIVILQPERTPKAAFPRWEMDESWVNFTPQNVFLHSFPFFGGGKIAKEETCEFLH